MLRIEGLLGSGHMEPGTAHNPPVDRPGPGWWSRLRLQRKVWAILLLAFLPLVLTLAVHVRLINQLRTVQQEHQQTVLARYQILLLRRLAINIEDGFRGYLLTEQDEFLKPLEEAGPTLNPAVAKALELVGTDSGLEGEIRLAHRHLNDLLESKQALIRQVKDDHAAEVLRYVRSRKGLALSETVLNDLRTIEDELYRKLQDLEGRETGLAERLFRGLLLALAGGLGLALLGARLLTKSITGPLAALQVSTERLGDRTVGSQPEPIAVFSSDEIGQLARSFEDMSRRIGQQIRELEAINVIGHEINTIGPDGLDGVLKRITDRAAELLQVDVCLVMLRNDKMQAWIVEAASGEWHERLAKSVMLWEEFPVSVRAFETREPAIGEDLRSDRRPEVVRRNLIGESMLSIPLLSRGAPFGVLVLLQENKVSRAGWNVRLAKGFADEAAVAIANAHLYEAAHQKEKGLASRLRQLEHLAETLAHDLKAPGERVEGFAAILLKEYDGKLDERAVKWLRLIEQNGKDLTARVHDILQVARVGVQREAVEAVDPALVLHDVLKARAGELERRRVQVRLETGFPMVACHRAYLRQVFDNLLSNAIKFSGERPDPLVRIAAERKGDRVHFSVIDNGVGIPPRQRDRVFDPFVRLNPGTVEGSGIGLTIVRRIIELYGGQVGIVSEDRVGCTVWFTLPVLGDFTRARPVCFEEM